MCEGFHIQGHASEHLISDAALSAAFCRVDFAKLNVKLTGGNDLV